MNYTEVTQLALDFADRKDQGTINNVDGFIKMAEARMNRLFKVREQSAKLAIPIVDQQNEYDLPADFGGMRTLRLRTALGAMYNFNYLTPEQYVERSQQFQTTYTNGKLYYCILGNKLAIMPAQSDETANIEMFYYHAVPNLNATDTTNWVSIDHPDMYVFGIQAQIAQYVKDYELRDSLNAMLASLVDELKSADFDERWGGPPMQQSLG